MDGNAFIFANDAARVLAQQLTSLPSGFPDSVVIVVAPTAGAAVWADANAEQPASPVDVAPAQVRDAALSRWTRSNRHRLIDMTDQVSAARPQVGSTDDPPEVTDDVWRTVLD